MRWQEPFTSWGYISRASAHNSCISGSTWDWLPSLPVSLQRCSTAQYQAWAAQTTTSCELRSKEVYSETFTYNLLVRCHVRNFFYNLCSVGGIAKVFPAIPLLRRQGIASVLLAYLKSSTSVINKPGGNEKMTFATWISVVQLLCWKSSRNRIWTCKCLMTLNRALCKLCLF